MSAVWWSAEVKTAPPLTLDFLREAFRKTQMCGLCGRFVAAGEGVWREDPLWVFHRSCPPLERTDA